MTRLSLEELGFQPDRYGLLQRLLVHEIDQGGTQAFATGIPGCGKTTMELHMAHASVLQGETTIWRGRPVDSWAWYPGPVKIWSDRPVTILRAPLGGGKPQPWVGPSAPRVHLFHGPDDLLERAEPGVLNVVYAREDLAMYQDPDDENGPPLRFWDMMVVRLAKKLDTRWHTLILDEVHEIWWDRPQKEDGAYARQTKVRDALADFRKTYNSLLMASHQVDELDYRILAKVQFYLYGRGARPQSKSRVNKELPLGLAQGEFILDSLYFCQVQFPKIPRPPFQVFVRPGALDPAAVAYEESVEVFLDDQVKRIETRELQELESSVKADGWDLWACGCSTRRRQIGAETAFETKPCREDRSCKVQRTIDEAARERGMPTRFVADA